MDFEELLKGALCQKVCANCKHSYLSYGDNYGYCKHQGNAYGPLPRRIAELDTCNYWEPIVRTRRIDDLP